jgi:hypothetical protein
VAGTNPDDRPKAPGESPPRRLERPPSERYGGRASKQTDSAEGATSGSALSGPFAKAAVVSFAGALALVVVGAILALTAGLPIAAGATGAATGLVLARAAVPAGGARPVARRTLAWLAIVLSVAAVAVAAVATWLIAQREGGTLGLLDYLDQTFGLFIPAEAAIAAATAAWGASAGPIQS